MNDKHDEKMNSVHFYLEEAKKIIAVKNADSDPPKTQQRFRCYRLADSKARVVVGVT